MVTLQTCHTWALVNHIFAQQLCCYFFAQPSKYCSSSLPGGPCEVAVWLHWPTQGLWGHPVCNCGANILGALCAGARYRPGGFFLRDCAQPSLSWHSVARCHPSWESSFGWNYKLNWHWIICPWAFFLCGTPQRCNIHWIAHWQTSFILQQPCIMSNISNLSR